MNKLLLVGLNHKKAPVDIREALALSEEDQTTFMKGIVGDGIATGVILLSTCNRVEIYVDTDTPEPEAIIGALAETGNCHSSLSADLFYVKNGREAARHLFRVACGLDSMVLGEPQILGQVKDAYFSARKISVVTTRLNLLFQKSFHVAKEVRTRSGLGKGAVTVSYAAFNLARGIFENLVSKKILLLGSGEMSRIVATHFKEHGVENMTVSNRTLERGREFAQQFGAEVVPWEEFPKALIHSDIVVCSTASQRPIIHRPMIETIMKMRRWAGLFIIDIAVPRDVEEEAGKVNGVYLYNIDDLQGTAREGLEARKQSAEQAEQIILDQLESYEKFVEHRRLSSLIEGLVGWVNEIEEEEIRKACRKLTLNEEKSREEIVRAAVTKVVHKLLHSPITQVKRLVIDENSDQAERYFLEFFKDAFPEEGEEDS